MIYEENQEKLIFGGNTAMEFLDAEHEELFKNLIERDNTSNGDNERKAFFYIIAGNNELYSQIDKIYNFTVNRIILDNYIQGKIMLSGGTSRMLYLAHHLYNGFSFKRINKDMEDRDLSINDVFSGLDVNGYKVCTNALHIRFGRMK
nr:DUF6075 family protein [Clostridium chromiireducens]